MYLHRRLIFPRTGTGRAREGEPRVRDERDEGVDGVGTAGSGITSACGTPALDG